MSSSTASTGRKTAAQKKDYDDILEDEERSVDDEPMTEEDRAFLADESVEEDEEAELELAKILLSLRKGKYKD